jgi:hypothetical protein
MNEQDIVHVYLLRSKNKVLQMFKHFKRKIKNQLSMKIKMIKRDWEWCWIQEPNIEWNDDAMLTSSKLPRNLWGRIFYQQIILWIKHLIRNWAKYRMSCWMVNHHPTNTLKCGGVNPGKRKIIYIINK